MTQDMHLDDEDIAAFVDGGLDAEARQRAEAHLLECDQCRGVLASASRLTTIPAASRRGPWLLTGGLAVAAAVVLLLLPAPPEPEQASRLREIEPIGTATRGFIAKSPADGVPVGRDTLIFRWAGLGDDAAYLITLSSEAGAIVWTQRTRDTILALPDPVAAQLVNGRTYYWQVDAVLPNLRAASTGQRQLIPSVR